MSPGVILAHVPLFLVIPSHDTQAEAAGAFPRGTCVCGHSVFGDKENQHKLYQLAVVLGMHI